jgi:hypothetical protein
MAKTMTFTYDGKDYTLEFTRQTVVQTEAMGFNANDIDTKPITSLSILFRGAFLAHHRDTRVSEIDKILEGMSKEGLLQALAELYYEPIRVLMEDNSKNAVKWTMT